ncbi:MAG: prepilin-type N-terminal cleavage/methylation domain-containing protein [Gemmatimonadota bacterium]|nr:prepilin-type N-terminal cleavage/methylation domain-containing protein [Gemmatimonadota bacterium]
MKKGIAMIGKAGFTLIEVLVTVVVIGVLAAVVIPAVTAQVTAGDASRVISDLNNLRTGIENFDIAVREFPGDVDDLVNKPGQISSSTDNNVGNSVDANILGATYTSTSGWQGPYSEAVLSSGVVSSTLPNQYSAAFNTGYSAKINNHFYACHVETLAACDASSPNYVVIAVDNLTSSQQGSLNDLIDGVNEANSSTSGKFRSFVSGTVAGGYYYATPFK